MKLSSKTHYGLMALHYLAVNYGKEPTSASELGKTVGVSPKYLEQILRKLQTRNVISSTRGAQGGYYLSREPEKITVGEVVRTLEDDMEIIECVSGGGKCKCCPTSGVWKKLYDGINALLDDITLKDVATGNVN